MRGWFHLGKWGKLVNLVALLWIIFLAVFLQFPYYMPVVADEMNYTCVIIAGGLLFEFAYYFVKRGTYKGPHLDATLSEAIEGVEKNEHFVPVDLSGDMKQ